MWSTKNWESLLFLVNLGPVMNPHHQGRLFREEANFLSANYTFSLPFGGPSIGLFVEIFPEGAVFMNS